LLDVVFVGTSTCFVIKKIRSHFLEEVTVRLERYVDEQSDKIND